MPWQVEVRSEMWSSLCVLPPEGSPGLAKQQKELSRLQEGGGLGDTALLLAQPGHWNITTNLCGG